MDFLTESFFDSQGDGSDYYKVFKTAGAFDKWPVQQPIRPQPRR